MGAASYLNQCLLTCTTVVSYKGTKGFLTTHSYVTNRPIKTPKEELSLVYVYTASRRTRNQRKHESLVLVLCWCYPDFDVR